MPKIDLKALQDVQEALQRYEAVVRATEMTSSTKKTYLLHSRNFVRWLADDFTPGINARYR